MAEFPTYKFPTYEEMGKKVAEEALDGYVYNGKTLREWVDTLSSLENQNKCDDAISRQAVLDLIYNSWKHNGVGENYGELSVDALKALPPVTPKQKMGRWIREKKHYKDDFQEFDYCDVRCSECGARKRIGWTNIRHCPMCGAKMEGSEDAE